MGHPTNCCSVQLSKYVCAIYMPNPKGGISFRASGILIANKLVLTWAHVFRYVSGQHQRTYC